VTLTGRGSIDNGKHESDLQVPYCTPHRHHTLLPIVVLRHTVRHVSEFVWQTERTGWMARSNGGETDGRTDRFLGDDTDRYALC
jgi:hypothetical protein